MSRRPLVAGNWKMNGSTGEALGLVNRILAELGPGPAEVVVCPPFTALSLCGDRLSDQDRVRLGAQDVFWEEAGAFTGAISPGMLTDCGCSHVIVGHSERRAHFRETDGEAAKKALAALSAGLSVMFCVGETLEEREGLAGAEGVVRRQLEPLVEGLAAGARGGDPAARADAPASFDRLVIAYEPVWAIGTGRAASPADAAAAAGWIRAAFEERCGRDAARALRVLYGGSVNPGNAASFFALPEVDGALVGGASLDARSFVAIVEAADGTSAP